MFANRLLHLFAVVVLLLTACAPENALTPEAPATTALASPVSSDNPLPIAAWNLDGDGTASIGDSSLEFSGSYAFSDTAVSFDGYTGSASTAAPGPINTTASFTVSAWVNYADRVSDTSVAVSQLGEVTGLFGLGVGNTSQWFFSRKTEDRTGLEYIVSADGTQATPSKSWTHLVGIYNKEAGVISLYVNGEPQAEAAYTAPLKANGPLVVGHSQFDSHPSNFWPGAIGQVAVYQVALTAEQVTEIYLTTKPLSPPLAQPAADPSTYANGILNGTWDYVVSDEEARQFFLKDYEVTADEVRVRLGFNNNQWYEVAVFDGKPFFVNGIPEGDLGTFRIEGDRMIQIGGQGQFQTAYTWDLDGDQLTLTVIEECNVTPTGLNCRNDKSQMDPIMIMITEHTYTKSGDNGSY